MMREHSPLKVMRSGLSGRWFAARVVNGHITDRWQIDQESAVQLEAMRDAYDSITPDLQTGDPKS